MQPDDDHHRDLAEWQAAKQLDPYGNDQHVRQLTDMLVATGIRCLQVHQLDREDAIHMQRLALLFDPPPGARVLDVGAGIGEPARLLHHQRPDLHLTLLNLSPAQLQRCPPFQRVCADFHSLPFQQASFDAAMILYALGHAFLPWLFTELAWVLRPGGVLFIWDITSPDPRPVIAALGYKPHPIDRICHAATLAGFTLDGWLVPQGTDSSRFAKLLGADAWHQLFATVAPIALRFIRSSNEVG